MAYKSKRRVADDGKQAPKKKVKARGVMERMRRRQRTFLVVLVVALLVPFGAYGIVNQLLGGRRGEMKATAYGRRVTLREFAAIGYRMTLAENLVRYFVINDPSLAAGMRGMSDENRWLFFRRLLQLKPQQTDDDVWERFILLHEADAFGLTVAPAEADSALALVFPDAEGGVNREGLAAFLRGPRGLTEEDVRQAVAEDMLVGGPLTKLRVLMSGIGRQAVPAAERLRLGPKLDRHLTATIQVSDDEVWESFLEDRQSYEVEYVSISAEPFIKDVPPPTEEERSKWYKDHKDKAADESDDGVGYYLPERCWLHTFVASVADFKKTVPVTDEELRDYYETNKERYRATTQPTTAPASRPTTRPATQPSTRSAAAPVSQPVPRPATRPATQPTSRPTTGPTTTQAVHYRPFDEVRDDIRRELAGQKAREAVREAVKKAGNARLSVEERIRRDAEEEEIDHQTLAKQIDYHALAKRYGMTYVPAPKAGVTVREAMQIEGLKDAWDPVLDNKTVDQVFFGRTTWDLTDLYDMDGNGYHVWRTARVQPRVQKYDEAKEAVERDRTAFTAYERAGVRAGELLNELADLQRDTDDALTALAAKHEGLTVETTKSFFLSSADFAPMRAGPDADASTRAVVRQGLFARRIRDENLAPGQSAVVGDQVARVQYLLRVAGRTDPDIEDFRQAVDRYRLIALERKRARFLKAWLEAVKKRADIQEIKAKDDTPGRKPT